MPDLRAMLEAMAAGQVVDEPRPDVVEPAVLEHEAPAFEAWRQFSRDSRGTPLLAPGELLGPLP